MLIFYIKYRECAPQPRTADERGMMHPFSPCRLKGQTGTFARFKETFAIIFAFYHFILYYEYIPKTKFKFPAPSFYTFINIFDNIKKHFNIFSLQINWISSIWISLLLTPHPSLKNLNWKTLIPASKSKILWMYVSFSA